MKIKLTKYAECNDPLFKASDITKWEYGKENAGVSLPINYWIEGTAEHMPIVGKPFIVNRTNRNGVECAGITITSVVQKIDTEANEFETFNSKYKIELIEENNKQGE